MAAAKTTPAPLPGSAPAADETFLPLKSLRLIQASSAFANTKGFTIGERLEDFGGAEVTAIFATPIGFLICFKRGDTTEQLIETGPGSGVVA